MLDFLRPDQRPVSWIFHPIDVHIQGNDIPLERLIFAQGYVVADDRALFSGLAKPELHRRLGADPREIDRRVTRACNPGYAGVQGLVKHNAYVAISFGTAKAGQQEDKHKREHASAQEASEA